MSESESEWLKAIASGDRGALGRLYDAYAPTLLAVGQRILKSRREAEDLLHDVFLEVWRQAADFDPTRGSLRAWLVTRVRSRALDRLKSAGYCRTILSDTLLAEELVPADPWASVGGQSLEAEALRAAVQQLAEEHRQVLWLAYFEGLSLTEIAQQLQLPLGTVKSRLARALLRLRAEVVSPESA